MHNPIAIAFGDVHLTLQPPACRSETDWLAVQAGYLKQVRDLAKALGDVPVLCSGDIFDRWDPKPELINFALEHLPDGMICVPGQHDLPNHRIEDMMRSGYGTLVKAGKIRDISGNSTGNMGGWLCYGFGWSQSITASRNTLKNMIRVALVHRYLWKDNNSKYPEAPTEARVDRFKEFYSFDFVISGDNHKAFVALEGKVLNQGTFIRRKTDEIHHHPRIAILYDNGTSDLHPLDVTKDKFHTDAKEREENALDLQSFISGLEQLGEQGLDFREAVKRHLQKEDVSPQTKQIILKALESHGN